MKENKLIFLIIWAFTCLAGCGGADPQTSKNNNQDTISKQTAVNKTDMITQKITPSLWVDKDAKAVVNYYLSIFKDGKLKEYQQYKNPPEAIEPPPPRTPLEPVRGGPCATRLHHGHKLSTACG